jgi:arylsulfate sulfotransferase
MSLTSSIRVHPSVIRVFARIVILVVVVSIAGLYFLPDQDYTTTGKTKELIQPAVQKQKKTEEDIKAYYQSKRFSLADPLVIQNPYGTAPLTALIIFDTPEAQQISIHIPGKTPQASIDFTFEEFSQYHEIPIYGLYADMVNKVTLTGKSQTGNLVSSVIELTTESLPIYLDKVKVTKSDANLYNPGMTFTFQENKLVFDINGDIRWYTTETTFQSFFKTKNGHFVFTFLIPAQKNAVAMEEDLLGKIYAVYDIPEGVQHDLVELPNGNFLLTSEDADSVTVEDNLIEVDRKTGYIVRRFDLKKYLDPARPHELGFETADWLHINSVFYDASDQSIILSGRVQSAVIKLSYPEMKPQWILGPPDHWSERFQPYLLTPQGSDFEWAWSQHHATLLAKKNLNGDIVSDVLLFDNGNYRSFSATDALSPIDSYSRMVLYRINETKLTVEQVWAYGKERGSAIFSNSRGSAYFLENGNYLGTWSEIMKDKNGTPTMNRVEFGINLTKIIEVNPHDNQVVFEANLTDSLSYRALRAGLYDGFSQKASNLAINLNDTTQFDLGKQILSLVHRVRKKLKSVYQGNSTP